MQANVGRETKAEKALSTALASAGLAHRKGVSPDPAIRCKVDVLFLRARICVFVDGCYWHGCPQHFKVPKSNDAWWREKIEANENRDRRQSAQLRVRGWSVVRIWEHDIGKDTVQAIVADLRHRIERRKIDKRLARARALQRGGIPRVPR